VEKTFYPSPIKLRGHSLLYRPKSHRQNGINALKRNWGAGLATDSPVAGLRSACLSRSPCRAFWFRRLATSVLLRRAALGFAVCSVAWPEGQRNSAVSLGSDRPKTLFASPAPPERSEDHSCFAVALARFRPKTLRFRRLAPLDPSEDVSNIAIAPPRRPEGFLNLAPFRPV
jgi:hypothetical protein